MDNIIQNTNWLLPTTVISNGAVTGNPWSNPNNLLLVDGDVAESNPNETASDIIVGNYNVNLPQNAVITGIQLQVIGYRGGQTTPPITLTPTAVDNTTGTDIFYPYITPFTGFTPDLATYILGGPNYLFATSWTPDMINNFKLQLLANGDIYIDSVLLQVFYYIPSEPIPPTPTPGVCVDCSSPVQLPVMYLALPFKANDRYAYLQNMNYANGTPFSYSDIGACGGSIFFVFDPTLVNTGNSNFAENTVVNSNVFTPLPDGTIQIDFGDISFSRGLQFHTPYAPDSNLRSDHDAQAEVIISDSAPYLGTLLRTCQIGQLVSAPIQVYENGSLILKPTVKFNFTGAGQATTADLFDPTQVNINIPGLGGTTPPLIVASTSGTSFGTKVTSLAIAPVLPVSGLQRGAVVNISTQQSVAVVSATVGGVSCTQEVTSTDVTHDLRNEQWLCVNPPLGDQPVVVTLSAPAWLTFGAEALAQIDTATPVGHTTSAAGTSNNPSLTFSTEYDYSIVIDGLTTGMTPILFTVGPGQGLNWMQNANTVTRQGASSVQAAGLEPDAVTMQYSMTQNTPWVYTALEIKGITSAVPPSAGVASVTGLQVNNTDPANPIILPKLCVDAADDVADYLDPKLNLHSSDTSVTITKTITNPGANEILDYNFQIPAVPVTTAASTGETIHQIGHGFSDGEVLKSSGTDDEFALAQANTAADAQSIGIVTNVPDVDHFLITTEGFATLPSLPGGAAAGNILFLDASTPGALTLTEPGAGDVSKPVAVVIDASTKLIYIHNYRGIINPTGYTASGDEAYNLPSVIPSGGSGAFTVNADETETTWWTYQLTSPQNLSNGVGSPDNAWNNTGSSAIGLGPSGTSFSIDASTRTAFINFFLGASSASLIFGTPTRQKIKFISNFQHSTSPTANYSFFGYYVQGNSITGSEGALTNVSARIGLVINNGNIYAVCANGSTITANILIPYTSDKNHEFVIDATFNGAILFYVDGTLLQTITTNLPGSGPVGMLATTSSLSYVISPIIVSQKIQ